MSAGRLSSGPTDLVQPPVGHDHAVAIRVEPVARNERDPGKRHLDIARASPVFRAPTRNRGQGLDAHLRRRQLGCVPDAPVHHDSGPTVLVRQGGQVAEGVLLTVGANAATQVLNLLITAVGRDLLSLLALAAVMVIQMSPADLMEIESRTAI